MRRRTTLALFVKIAAASAALICGPSAIGEDPVAGCIAANERSFDLRDQGKLLDARTQLAMCAASSCPDAIQKACRGRIAELNAAIPSIVFDVKDAAGRDLSDVKLWVDGQAAGAVAVTSLALDPGTHVFRFEAPGEPALERTIVLREGEKEKREAIVIGQADRSSTSNSGNRQRLVGWIVGGTGAVALGVAGVLGLVAKSSYEGASGCSGTICTDPNGLTTSNSARNLGNAATVVLIAGGAVALGGAVIWFTAPKGEPGEAKQVTWAVGVTPGAAALAGRF
jgi:hypothetical protein